MLIDETEAVTELSDGIEVTEIVTEDSELRVYISELNEHSAVIESGILSINETQSNILVCKMLSCALISIVIGILFVNIFKSR